jgi:predicted kinase
MYLRDPTFFDRSFEEFKRAVVRRDDIYLDNMNLTVESRKQFITLATVHGYRRIAYYFNVSFDELFKRHTLMRAKNKVRLSTYEVMGQLNRQTQPRFDEFDAVIQFNWNAVEGKYDVKLGFA